MVEPCCARDSSPLPDAPLHPAPVHASSREAAKIKDVQRPDAAFSSSESGFAPAQSVIIGGFNCIDAVSNSFVAQLMTISEM